MSLKKHLGLLIYSFITWLTFYLLGLPEYYQQYPFWVKLALVVIVTALYFPVTRMSLRKFWSNGDHQTHALWLALYLTLPLFVYDYLLLAWYKGYGIGFVIPFWYLTFFYFSFWIQFPFVARRLERQQPSVTSAEL